MDVYKAKIQSDESLNKLKLRIMVRRYLQNKELFVGTWSPKYSMRNLRYFLADAVNHKLRVHQFYFIRAILQEKIKNRVFVKLDSRYADYFPEHSNYFERDLRLLKSMHGMTNSGKLFDDELWFLEAGFIKSQCQMPIYYNYAPDRTKHVVLSYVDDCVP